MELVLCGNVPETWDVKCTLEYAFVLCLFTKPPSLFLFMTRDGRIPISRREYDLLLLYLI